MDPKYSRAIQKTMPKANKVICEGIAVEHLKRVESFIDNVWKNAIAPLKDLGLEYIGYRRCTPDEAFQFASSRSTKGKRYLEMEKTEMFLVKYFLRLNGEDMEPIYQYLPYASLGGLITIKDSKFMISPVLIDRAISIGTDHIFVNVGKDKFSFMRSLHTVNKDGVNKAVYVVWANIHHVKRSARTKGSGPYRHVDMNACPMLYLLCKHGVTNTFKQYFGVDVKVGYEEITEEVYPKDKWSIYRASGRWPRTYTGTRLRAAYKPSRVRIAVKHDGVMRDDLDAAVAGLYYIIDHFPDIVEVKEMESTDLWRLILGYITFKKDVIMSKLLQDIDNHIASVDTYVDELVRQRMAKGGISIRDTYDLFLFMIQHLPTLVANNAANINELYGKEFSVLPYIMANLVESIHTFAFSLRTGNAQALQYREVEKKMRWLNPRLSRGMNRSNPAVTSVSSAGDNMLFKITTVMVQQANFTGSRKRGAGNIDSSKLLNASIAEAANWNLLPKSSPSGYERINPYVHIDEDSVVVRNPKLIDIIDETQKLIQR